jgi:hypothetical protein
MTVNIGQVREEVIGFRPVYTEQGNNTEIILATGMVLLDRRGLKSVLKVFAKNYAIDMKAQKAVIEKMMGRRGVMPFYINSGRVFVPFKMRQDAAGNDMVYGYVDVNFIEDIPDKAGKTCITRLKTGLTVELFSSAATARKSLYMGLDLMKWLGAGTQADQSEEAVVRAAKYIIYEFRDIGAKLDRLQELIAERSCNQYRFDKDNEN